jgi:hypothetical protein
LANFGILNCTNALRKALLALPPRVTRRPEAIAHALRAKIERSTGYFQSPAQQNTDISQIFNAVHQVNTCMNINGLAQFAPRSAII